jgi:transposase
MPWFVLVLQPSMKITSMHLPSTLLPLQDGLQVEDLDVGGDVLMVTLFATAPLARCPLCATPSSRIHSRYRRRAADLPWGAVTLRLLLRVRRFSCAVRECSRRIFTERLPHLLRPYARRTVRAQEVARAVALAVGGEGVRAFSRAST